MLNPPEGMSRADFVRAVDLAICERRTRKVLAGPAGERFEQDLLEAIRVSGLAPFHFAREQSVPEPWRYSVFFGEALQRAQKSLDAAGLMYGKLPAIFAGAGAMVHATWLPEIDAECAGRDWEHMAAASSAVQNLLLATHARGIASYWCSASMLGSAEAHACLDIPVGEEYLGSLFFGAPLPADEEAERGWPGKMHARRTVADGNWMRVAKAD